MLVDPRKIPEVVPARTSDDPHRRWFYNVWTTIGAIILIGVGIYLMNILSVPVGIMIWTLVIVFCLRGLVDSLSRKGLSRVLATSIAYVVMCLVLVLIGVLLFSPAFGISSQLKSLISSVPTYISEIAAWGQGLYEQYAYLFDDETVRSWINDGMVALSTWASGFASRSAAGVVNIGAGIVNTFMVVGIAFVVAFWVLMELPALGREMERLAGEKHRDGLRMFNLTLNRVMGGYIKGTVIQCIIIGVASGVLFALCGIPYAMALGAISGVLNIIPIVGPWIGGVIAAVLGLFVSPWAAIIAVVGIVVIQQFVATFIAPRIMQNSVDVHPAVTIVAIMAGSAIGSAMGGFTGSLVGMLLSIPAVALAKSLFVYYFEKHTGRRLVAEDGVLFKGVPPEGTSVDPVADAVSPHPDVSAAFEKIEQRRAERKRSKGGFFKHDD